ncbi:hypothetical protein [Antrihabitans sp. YC2-6]|uniref:hypothetical protein n=1 Tax=Antrihabitans sp. YC2-6 TaxID=2799498 RepID=UPI0018F5CE73|nr:hypothetical protein [Antrihabitans sp. YC2-6]MBJ8348300.1 hypothetical protein [Antrihabitans sp. YC2-6]
MIKKLAVVSAIAAGTFFAGAATAAAAQPAAPGPDDLVVGVVPGVTYISYATGEAAFLSGAGSVIYDNTGYHVVDATGAPVF